MTVLKKQSPEIRPIGDVRGFCSEPPESCAGALCSWIFPWMYQTARGRTPGLHDLGPCPEALRCHTNCEKLAKLLKKVPGKGKIGLPLGIVRFYGFTFILSCFFIALSGLLKGALQPILLLYLFHPERSPLTVNELVAIFTLSVLVRPTLNAYAKFLLHFVSTQITSGFTALIYDKMLRLNRNGMHSSSVGQIINIVTNDLRKLYDANYRLCQVVAGTFDGAGAFYVVWFLMGVGMLPGLFFALISPLFGALIIWLLKRARLQFSLVVDERSEIMNDVLGGIRVVKMYAWEKAFCNIIVAIRKRELKLLGLVFWVTVLNSAVFSVSGRLMTFFSITVEIFAGFGDVNLDDIFVSLLVFNHLRVICFILLPEAIIHIADVGSVLERLKEVLLLPEVEDNVTFLPTSEEEPCGVEAVDISRSWNTNAPEFQLSFSSRGGELVVITGTVSSGKTSLLCALFGECPLTSGKIRVYGKVAFAPQDPWIMARTVKENIVMDFEYDHHKYKKVVEVCALKKDFEQLTDGDQTLVGEKGSTLSGGQKARISLARALYSDADVYFLDSPFNAVDPKVFNHIFNKAILEHLAHKTVILISSQTNCYKKANRIYVMDKGRVIAVGPFAEVQDSLFIMDKDKERQAEVDSVIPDKVVKRKSTTGSVEYPLLDDSLLLKEDINDDETFASWQVYYKYISLGNRLPAFLCLFILCLTIESLFKFADIWIIAWVPMNNFLIAEANCSSAEIINQTTKGNLAIISWAYTGSVSYDIMLYGLMLLVGFILSIIFGAGLCKAGMSTARTLHDTSLKRVLHTNIDYFASNSEEKIMNDFTRDTTMVDEDIPLMMLKVLKYGIEIIGCISFGLIFRPVVGLVVLIVAILTRYISQVYLKCARNFKHLEANSYAPLFSHMGDTWRGLPVIRASRMQTSFLAEFRHFLDQNISAGFAANSLLPWFSTYQELLSTSYIIALLIFFVREFITTGRANIMGLLALVMAAGFMGIYQHTVLSLCEIDGKIISVDRMYKYWDLIPEEPESEIQNPSTKRKMKMRQASVTQQINPIMTLDDGTVLERSQNGLEGEVQDFQNGVSCENLSVVFHKVSLAYDGNMALKNLSFQISLGEKIGVVGRTGAGKSSLISALFRLTVIESGSIHVAGIDASTVPLADLRRNMAIIPQDPILFSGSVRMNLDPEEKYPDYHIWNVLKEVQLDGYVSGLSGGLYSVLRSGEMSVGQRQLFCLARAIMGQKKILIMDEATANIDHRTEEIIQKALSDKFKQCTVIIIAHKIHSVLGCHRVMVLEKGEIFEFDSPSALMKNEDGIFYSLLKHSEVRNPLENHL